MQTLTEDLFVGHCNKGPACLYRHDPTAVAICSAFLQKGACPLGDSCDLSHDPTPERVPACTHFLRGKCSNPACRYAHVRVNPASPICRDFAVLGYCSAGADCSNRHLHECPDYANIGACRKKKCSLPHVDHAGQIRRLAAQSTDPASNADEGMTTVGNGSDLSSDEDEDAAPEGEDFDSDDLEDVFMEGLDDSGHQALAEQDDFVGF